MPSISTEVWRAVRPAVRLKPATPHCARTPEGAGYGRWNGTVVARAAGNVALTRGALRIAGGPTRELGPPRVSRRPASRSVARGGARHPAEAGNPTLRHGAPGGAGYGRRNSTVVARADGRVARAGRPGGAGGCLSAGATRGRGAAPGVGVPFAAVTGAERPD